MIDKEIRNISSTRLFIQNFSRKKLGVACAIIISTIYLVGIFAPFLAPYDYSETNLLKTQAGPDFENLLGTDRLGRDILSRVIWGIQTTVIVTITGLLTGSLILGLFLGLLAGFYKGIFDFVVMRVGELVSSFPDILLIILLAATLRPRITNLFYKIEDNLNISGLISSGIIDYLVIGLALLPLSWFGTMRLIRAQVFSIREIEYVQSARTSGAGTFRIITKHILPNVISPLIVTSTFGLGAVALSEVILSFFGLGVQPPRPSLGAMLSDVSGRGGASVSVLTNHPEQLLSPIIVIWVMIFCWNIIGDALTDILNPKKN
ncbi:ABC transporter permease [Chloroflexi bacterium]|nr:ABC transporter permease [Chloroflexota bacterium]RZP12566.1 MAG: ABC transporter permease [Chloroflexota bacterium]|tara:strand:- start:1481 stop:2437 length:957 start_codon:yes stop_codon:yes gene_type:complete